MAHGTFCWNELMTGDVEKAKAFYSATIGWKWEEMPMSNGSYWIASYKGEQVAGMMPLSALPPGAPTCWFSYLEVDNCDKRAAAVEKSGGKVLRPAFDVPGVGRIVIVSDPTGAMLGLMTPEQQ